MHITEHVINDLRFVEVSPNPRATEFPDMALRLVSTTKFKNVY